MNRPAAVTPAVHGGAGAGASNPSFLGNNKQFQRPPRPANRFRPPPPKHQRRGGGGGCCRCCLYTTLIIIFLLLLSASVLYLLYRPQIPSVTVNSLGVTAFNLTDATITSDFNFAVTTSNPNIKIAFAYDQISLYVLSGDVVVGDGTLSGFIHPPNNVTTFSATISRSNASIPTGTDLSALHSSVRDKQLPVYIVMDTKVQVRIGKLKVKKIKIRVRCRRAVLHLKEGTRAPAPATVSRISCKAKPMIKILNWTILQG